jgi:hypothetical protein
MDQISGRVVDKKLLTYCFISLSVAVGVIDEILTPLIKLIDPTVYLIPNMSRRMVLPSRCRAGRRSSLFGTFRLHRPQQGCNNSLASRQQN